VTKESEGAGLIEIFEAGVYTVFAAAGAIRLPVGQPSPEAAALLATYGAKHAALISAMNPMAMRQSDEANAVATAALTAEVRALGLPVLGAEGASEDGVWREESVFVIGLDPAAAGEIARRYRQAAWFSLDEEGVGSVLSCDVTTAGARRH
jgi:hypothetical protein